jgi:hypothetical protein
MFGLFKKKQPTMMDAFIRTMYGPTTCKQWKVPVQEQGTLPSANIGLALAFLFAKPFFKVLLCLSNFNA